MKDRKRKPSVKPSAKPDPYPWLNDGLEFAVLVVTSFGVGGGLLALLYLAHQAGVI